MVWVAEEHLDSVTKVAFKTFLLVYCPYCRANLFSFAMFCGSNRETFQVTLGACFQIILGLFYSGGFLLCFSNFAVYFFYLYLTESLRFVSTVFYFLQIS